jgi:hypothetical protein
MMWVFALQAAFEVCDLPKPQVSFLGRADSTLSWEEKLRHTVIHYTTWPSIRSSTILKPRPTSPKTQVFLNSTGV